MPTPFQIYWAKLVRKNIALTNPEGKMTISIESFRKQQEQAFNEGRKSLPTKRPSSPLDGIF